MSEMLVRIGQRPERRAGTRSRERDRASSRAGSQALAVDRARYRRRPRHPPKRRGRSCRAISISKFSAAMWSRSALVCGSLSSTIATILSSLWNGIGDRRRLDVARDHRSAPSRDAVDQVAPAIRRSARSAVHGYRSRSPGTSCRSRARRADSRGSTSSPAVMRSPGMISGMPGGYGTTITASVRPISLSISTLSTRPRTRCS